VVSLGSISKLPILTLNHFCGHLLQERLTQNYLNQHRCRNLKNLCIFLRKNESFFSLFFLFFAFCHKSCFFVKKIRPFFPLSTRRCCEEKSYQMRKYSVARMVYFQNFFNTFCISTYNFFPFQIARFFDLNAQVPLIIGSVFFHPP